MQILNKSQNTLLFDCTGDTITYVVVWHNEGSLETDEMSDDVTSRMCGEGGEGRTSVITSAVHGMRRADTQCTQTMGVRKRRARQPTTSMLSEKVWREMRKHIAGRDQHDGVT